MFYMKKSRNKIKKNNKFKTKKKRYEIDVLGKIEVPQDHYWGSTTQRSLKYMSIGTDTMPLEFIYAYVLFKKCAVIVNYKLKLINKKKKDIIVKVCNEIINGHYNNEFPLHIWQTGSGTHTNMNINEVIANICNKKLTGKLGTKSPIHPNNDVNMSQSSNDSFITAIHMYIAININKKLIPNVKYMISGFKKKQHEFKNIIKLGRTHLEDAMPITFGEEFSGYVSSFENSLHIIKLSLKDIYYLAAGGTAVGTGVNTNPKFGKMVASQIASETKLPFLTAPNKYAVLSNHNAVLNTSNALKLLATNLMKIANDIRWMGSGPRGGLNELILPETIPGSSIMAGKVNPIECEAAAMVSIQVMANNLAISFANSQGYFELNVYNPLMVYNMSKSLNMLSGTTYNFTKYCILKLKVNKKKVKSYLDNALTLATILNPYIGYDKATKLAHYANDHNISLKEANRKLKYLSEEDMDKYLVPSKMV